MATDVTAGSAEAGARRRFPPRLATGVGALFVLWGANIGAARLSDNSFFTHVATGRLILDSGIPTEDPYSFTAAGEPWVVQSWLASLVYGVVDEVAGGLGLRLVSLVLAAVLAALIWRLTAPAATLLPRAGIAALALATGTTFWSPRPLLAGLVLLAATLVVVGEGRDPRWLVPVFVVWVNVHGSWPLGLVAVACIAIGTHLDGGQARPALRALAWASGSALVAAVVNPIGPKMLVFPLGLLERSEVLQSIVEWQSPSFDELWARVFLLQVVVAVLALARRGSFRAAVPLVVFVAAALLGLRNIPVASIVLLPGMALGLAGMGSLEGRRREPVGAVLVGFVVVAGLVVVGGSLTEEHYDLRAYPTDSLAWAQEVGLAASPDANLLTEEWVGNLLELEVGTDARVFLDDRVDMYPVPVIEDFLAVHGGGPRALGVLERWEVDAVLWPASSSLTALLEATGDWVVVHREVHDDGASWVVLCREGAAPCQGLDDVGTSSG